MQYNLSAAVLISGSGTNLQAIMDYVRDHAVPCDIRVVISNETSAYGLTRARAAGIPTEIVDHREFPDRQSFDRALQQAIDFHKADAVFLAGFMRILTHELVRQFEGRMLNIHPSLLPELKGMDTHRRALEAGFEYHGATVHFVTPELDDGPSIVQGKLKIHKNESPEQLQQRVHRLEYRIYPLAVEWMATNRLQFIDGAVWLDGNPLPENGAEILDENP